MTIPTEAFQPIIDELRRKPLSDNKYRLIAGHGKSQTFGVVNRRSLPADYSRLCWLRPYLYKLLLEFGDKYVTVPYTSITVNQNYRAKAHKDKGNVGPSFLVAFGDYTGGDLKLWESDEEHSVDVRQPLVRDFSQVLHEVAEFQGERFSLVYYTLEPRNFKNQPPLVLPPPSVIPWGSKWAFKRGDVVIKNGLPHPLKGRKVVAKSSEPVTLVFS